MLLCIPFAPSGGLSIVASQQIRNWFSTVLTGTHSTELEFGNDGGGCVGLLADMQDDHLDDGGSRIQE